MVKNQRYYQFFAVHETEAWLLSDPGLFPRQVREAFPAQVRNPESVNFSHPPSKLLEHLYGSKMKSEYYKVKNANNFFQKLDPNTAYNKCPRLKQLLDTLLSLAKLAEESNAISRDQNTHKNIS